jgi:hypothetical protein
MGEMKIIKRILMELAFIFRWKDKKYGDWFMEWHKELVNEAIDKIDINTNDIKIIQKPTK